MNTIAVTVTITRDRRFLLCNGRIVNKEQLEREPYGAHVIGEITQAIDEGYKVTALQLYTQGWDLAWRKLILSDFPRTIATIIGDARNLRCTVCGKTQRWEMSDTALRAVIRGREKRGPNLAGTRLVVEEEQSDGNTK